MVAADVGNPLSNGPDLAEIQRAVRAAAILACSDNEAHRRAAYRIVTSAYELQGASELPLDQAVRVVLARLGNFPALLTRSQINNARADLPTPLLAEEIFASDERTVKFGDEAAILTDLQYDIWARLRRGDRMAIAAPTSAGKSFVLQRYLASLLLESEARSVIYLVPTRALISQVSSDFHAQLTRLNTFPGDSGVAIVTVPLDATRQLPGRAIYVLTQERAQATLSAHPELLPDVIVADEAQGISDGSRGVRLLGVLEEVIRRKPGVQVIFASPGVKNLQVFGRMLNLEDVVPIRSVEQTVAQNLVVVRVLDTEIGSVSVHLAQRQPEANNPPLAEVSIGKRTSTRIEKLANVATTLGRGATNLVYANGPADAESVALEIAELLRDRSPDARRSELARLAAEAVHETYALVDCVKVGVGFHYSNMPTQLRLALEQAMGSGIIDYLVCTSTLLQGVNLPAKNIFMFRPEKGDNRPLGSVDFWNLAGRAGRLRQEFQGNIFMIDYSGWRRHPLTEDREATIVPALDTGIASRRVRLLEVLHPSGGLATRDTDLEAVSLKLMGEFRRGSLPALLERIRRDNGLEPQAIESVFAGVSAASASVTLPYNVLQNSPDISPHKQQRLYDELAARAGRSGENVRSLIPQHPTAENGYESISQVLQICHRLLLNRPSSSKLHRFLGLVSLWWMQGRPLPRIIQNQLNRNPEKGSRLIIRETLELIERDIRFQCVRLTSCYNNILVQLLRDVAKPELEREIPDVPLYLELGAASQTIIGLISLGLSRPTATRLALAAPGQNMNVEDIRVWLRDAPDAIYSLPPSSVHEIVALLPELQFFRRTL